MDRRKLLIGGAGAGMLALGGAAMLRQGTAPAPLLPVSAANAQTAEESGGVELPEISMGNPDSAVTLYEYASFSCPVCKTFHETVMPQVKAQYIDTGLINFVYREAIHNREGLWATMLARCVEPDRYFGIADVLYTQQDDWRGQATPRERADALRRIGRLAGLSEERLDACFTDADLAQALIDRHDMLAQEYGEFQRGVHTLPTPTIYVNDTKLEGWGFDTIAAHIDEALAEAR